MQSRRQKKKKKAERFPQLALSRLTFWHNHGILSSPNKIQMSFERSRSFRILGHIL